MKIDEMITANKLMEWDRVTCNVPNLIGVRKFEPFLLRHIYDLEMYKYAMVFLQSRLKYVVLYFF